MMVLHLRVAVESAFGVASDPNARGIGQPYVQYQDFQLGRLGLVIN